jgi:hypothetical protein
MQSSAARPATRTTAPCPRIVYRIVLLALLVLLVVFLCVHRGGDDLVETKERVRDVPAHVSNASTHGTQRTALTESATHAAIAAPTTVVAAAYARRVPVPPTLTAGVSPTDAVTAALPDAIQRVWPSLRVCYETSFPDRPEIAAELDLTVTADAHHGTRIEADVVLDPAKRLPPAMVDCVRSELSTLELPVLAPGESVTIRQVFAFGPD